LLDNALKYSKPSGTISVSLSMAAGQPKIVVHDNGIGISPIDLPFVFDRFYRADPSRGIVEGNGLGLAIAKWIAETHQSELSVTSDPDSGTSFTIVFAYPRTSKPEGTVREIPVKQNREQLCNT
jgi:signal transduction histidine kinase